MHVIGQGTICIYPITKEAELAFTVRSAASRHMNILNQTFKHLILHRIFGLQEKTTNKINFLKTFYILHNSNEITIITTTIRIAIHIKHRNADKSIFDSFLREERKEITVDEEEN